MARVVTSYNDGTYDVNEVTEYAYNDAGIRVESYYYETEDGGAKQNEETTTFLIDSRNHTGYAQVLEQWTDGAHPDITYTIGADIISQSSSAGVRHLLYDGHGSTRQLIASDGSTVDDSFSYDGYGVMLGGNPAPGSSPATPLLYAGEHFDTDMQHYYLRARWYDQQNGRFNRMDPFAGNSQDPQSLHKYLYVHNNPINSIDPTGNMEFSLGGLMSSMGIGALIGGITSGLYNAGQQILSGGDFDLREFLIEIGCGMLIGALAGAAGYIFSFVAKSFLGVFRLSNTALTVGTGALTGLAAAFVGQVLTELKYWIVDDKPFVLRNAANRVLLASFAGLVTGGVFTKFSLHRGWISDISGAPVLRGLPGSANAPYLGYVPTGWLPQAVPTSPVAACMVTNLGIVGGVLSQAIVEKIHIWE